MTDKELKFTVSAPGKIILIGEHSVVYKRRGVATSINRRTFINFREYKEAHEQITFSLKNFEEIIEWDFKNVYDLIMLNKPLNVEINEFSLVSPENLNHSEYIVLIKELVTKKISGDDPKQKAAMGIFYAILGMLWCTDIDISPFDFEVVTDLTIGAGTGSSASFAVCIAASIFNYVKLKAFQKFGSGEHNISNAIFKPLILNLKEQVSEFSVMEKEIINNWAFNIEKINHTTPSGIDNTVCTFGNAVLLNSISEKEKSSIKLLDDIPSFHVLLVNTGVSRSTSEMALRVSNLHKSCPEAVESILDSMDIIAMKFIEYSQELKLSNEQDKILNIYRKLETLFDLQQGHLSTLGVSHPRLDEICFITKRRGFHSKLTGAGGGGFAITLIPPDATEDCIKETILDLKGSGFLAEAINLNERGLSLEVN